MFCDNPKCCFHKVSEERKVIMVATKACDSFTSFDDVPTATIIEQITVTSHAYCTSEGKRLQFCDTCVAAISMLEGELIQDASLWAKMELLIKKQAMSTVKQVLSIVERKYASILTQYKQIFDKIEVKPQ